MIRKLISHLLEVRNVTIPVQVVCYDFPEDARVKLVMRHNVLIDRAKSRRDAEELALQIAKERVYGPGGLLRNIPGSRRGTVKVSLSSRLATPEESNDFLFGSIVDT